MGFPTNGRTAFLFLLFLVAAFSAGNPSQIAGRLDAEGLRRTIAAERGRVVLVNFWATWCVPCREEFPGLVRLQKLYGERGLRVLGVSTDLDSESRKVEEFLAEQKPPFPNYLKKGGGDDQQFIEAVDSSWGGELPFSVLYGRDGKKARVLPGKHSYGEFERAVKELLSRETEDGRR